MNNWQKTTGSHFFRMSFRFLRSLGHGVNGQVCLLETLDSYEAFAVKRLSISMQRELHIWKQLSPHPNILAMCFVKTFDDVMYIFMEEMHASLQMHLSNTRLTGNEIEWIFHEVLGALAHCHSKQILHRDVKPDNILLDANGCVKLCDFSLSRCGVNDNMTHPVVTLWYRSPELLMGSPYDFTIDTWSACCVLLQMTHGQYPPFMGAENSEISQLGAIYDIIGTPTMLKDAFRMWPGFVQRTFIYKIEERPSALDCLTEVKCLRQKKEDVTSFGLVRNCRATFDTPPVDWQELLNA